MTRPFSHTCWSPSNAANSVATSPRSLMLGDEFLMNAPTGSKNVPPLTNGSSEPRAFSAKWYLGEVIAEGAPCATSSRAGGLHAARQKRAAGTRAVEKVRRVMGALFPQFPQRDKHWAAS